MSRCGNCWVFAASSSTVRRFVEKWCTWSSSSSSNGFAACQLLETNQTDSYHELGSKEAVSSTLESCHSSFAPTHLPLATPTYSYDQYEVTFVQMPFIVTLHVTVHAWCHGQTQTTEEQKKQENKEQTSGAFVPFCHHQSEEEQVSRVDDVARKPSLFHWSCQPVLGARAETHVQFHFLYGSRDGLAVAIEHFLHFVEMQQPEKIHDKKRLSCRSLVACCHKQPFSPAVLALPSSMPRSVETTTIISDQNEDHKEFLGSSSKSEQSITYQLLMKQVFNGLYVDLKIEPLLLLANFSSTEDLAQAMVENCDMTMHSQPSARHIPSESSSSQKTEESFSMTPLLLDAHVVELYENIADSDWLNCQVDLASPSAQNWHDSCRFHILDRVWSLVCNASAHDPHRMIPIAALKWLMNLFQFFRPAVWLKWFFGIAAINIDETQETKPKKEPMNAPFVQFVEQLNLFHSTISTIGRDVLLVNREVGIGVSADFPRYEMRRRSPQGHADPHQQECGKDESCSNLHASPCPSIVTPCISAEIKKTSQIIQTAEPCYQYLPKSHDRKESAGSFEPSGDISLTTSCIQTHGVGVDADPYLQAPFESNSSISSCDLALYFQWLNLLNVLLVTLKATTTTDKTLFFTIVRSPLDVKSSLSTFIKNSQNFLLMIPRIESERLLALCQDIRF